MLAINKPTDSTFANLICFFDEDKEAKDVWFNTDKVGDVTFIYSQKKYYLYLGKKSEISVSNIYRIFVDNINKITTNINFNINDSFLNNEFHLTKSVILAIMFILHKPWKWKTIEKMENKKWNIKCEFLSKNQLTKILSIGDAVNIARDFQDGPPNIMTPDGIINKTKDIFKNQENLSITVLSKNDIVNLKMNLFLSVSAGNKNEGKIMILKYIGNQETDESISIIGKGITFDAGGYSLKPSSGMKNMRYDMSGAAAVISLANTIINTRLKKNIYLIAPLTENIIGRNATLNTSIVQSMSGKTVRLVNMDAEGRLVMADCITYSKKILKSQEIITVATLTGAMIRSLGTNISGVLVNQKHLFDKIKNASVNSGERVWQMPLTKQGLENMMDEYADIKNSYQSNYGTTQESGAFLNFFAEETPLMHIDIAGTAYDRNKDRGKGTMVKTLSEYLINDEK